jgi:hypothetical protein
MIINCTILYITITPKLVCWSPGSKILTLKESVTRADTTGVAAVSVPRTASVSDETTETVNVTISDNPADNTSVTLTVIVGAGGSIPFKRTVSESDTETLFVLWPVNTWRLLTLSANPIEGVSWTTEVAPSVDDSLASCTVTASLAVIVAVLGSITEVDSLIAIP